MYITVFSLFVTLVFGTIVIYALPDQLDRRGARSVEHSAYSNAQLLGDLLPVVHQAAQRWVSDNLGFEGEIVTADIESFLPSSFRATPRFRVDALSNGAVLTRIRGMEGQIDQAAIVARANQVYRDQGVGIVRGGQIFSPVYGQRLDVPMEFMAAEGEVVIYSPRLP